MLSKELLLKAELVDNEYRTYLRRVKNIINIFRATGLVAWLLVLIAALLRDVDLVMAASVLGIFIITEGVINIPKRLTRKFDLIANHHIDEICDELSKSRRRFRSIPKISIHFQYAEHFCEKTPVLIIPHIAERFTSDLIVDGPIKYHAVECYKISIDSISFHAYSDKMYDVIEMVTFHSIADVFRTIDIILGHQRYEFSGCAGGNESFTEGLARVCLKELSSFIPEISVSILSNPVSKKRLEPVCREPRTPHMPEKRIIPVSSYRFNDDLELRDFVDSVFLRYLKRLIYDERKYLDNINLPGHIITLNNIRYHIIPFRPNVIHPKPQLDENHYLSIPGIDFYKFTQSNPNDYKEI